MLLRRKSHTRNKASPSKKQQALDDTVRAALTRVSSLYGIFLVRQALKARTENFIAIASSKDDAIWFCRNYLAGKYCQENVKNSLQFYDPLKGETLRVNYDRNHLLIKGVDFNRREPGRTNQDPLWYLNVAEITIINKNSFTK